MGDNMESSEWDDQKLSCVSLGSECHKTENWAEASVRSTLFVEILVLESAAMRGMNQQQRGSFSWLFADFPHLVPFMMILILKLKY